MDYSVLVTDNYRASDQSAAALVTGFVSLEAAVAYARRRTYASVEDMRSPATSSADVRSAFLLFGETSVVVAGGEQIYNARDELEYFVNHPASADECDWLNLEPDQPASPVARADAGAQGAAPVRKT